MRGPRLSASLMCVDYANAANDVAALSGVADAFHLDVMDGHFAPHTLAYHDGVSLPRRATAPALFSVAQRDTACPPSTVFAAHNHHGARAEPRPMTEIAVHEFNIHEGGQASQMRRKLRRLGDLLGPGPQRG